jgi:protein-S-isoprenylcysteine O-methyltransferase Ste14
MNVNLMRLARQFVGLLLFTSLTLFLPAGTINWIAGWVFLVLFLGFFLVVELWLFKHNPRLMEERMHFTTPDQKGWDKIVFPMLGLLPFAQFIVISLDANRFHWLSVPISVQVVGCVLLLFSFYLFFLTFRENSYLSTVVRIQEERGHAVISTGPYRYVRHPMYAGIIIFTVGTPLLLGSYYGVLFGSLLIMLLMHRTILEERTLQEELEGYTDYMAEVQYRVLPYIW